MSAFLTTSSVAERQPSTIFCRWQTIVSYDVCDVYRDYNPAI